VVDANASSSDLLELSLAKLKKHMNEKNLDSSHFILKTPTIQDYIVATRGSRDRILYYDYVRRQIGNGFGKDHKTAIPLVLCARDTLHPDLMVSVDEKTADLYYPDSAVDRILARELPYMTKWDIDEQTKFERNQIISMHPRATSIYTFKKPFIFRIASVRGVKCTDAEQSFFIKAEVFHGGKLLTAPVYSYSVNPPPEENFHGATNERSVSTVIDDDHTGKPVVQRDRSSTTSLLDEQSRFHRRKEIGFGVRYVTLEFNQWLEFRLRFQDMPRGARICLTLYRRGSKGDPSALIKGVNKSDVPLGWMARQLVNEMDILRKGPDVCHLWPDEERNPVGTCTDNRRNRSLERINLYEVTDAVAAQTEQSSSSTSAARFRALTKRRALTKKGHPASTSGSNLTALPTDESDPNAMDVPLLISVEYYSRHLLYFPSLDQTPQSLYLMAHPSRDEVSSHKRKLAEIIRKDPLDTLNGRECQLLWRFREYLSRKPQALAKFMLAISWNNHWQVIEAHRLLRQWAKPSPLQALELLDSRFSCPIVREYAVNILEKELSQSECLDIMLQLTQALKNEAHHDSALARFLLSQATHSEQLGQSFFWLLKVELDQPDVAERNVLLLETYLRTAGPKRIALQKQCTILDALLNVARAIKEVPSSERLPALRQQLANINFPPLFELPLDQRWQSNGLLIEKCKYMDSKMVPLWLVFKNIDRVGPTARPHSVILKVGDDLRQDALTIQILRLMDRYWKNEGLDLRLRPYNCVATGDFTGMIEVVLNSATAANINADHGGNTKTGSAKSVMISSVLTKWLEQHNPTPEQFRRAQENFKLSCAGYCVATYVMGIGDRHNDNIMLQKSGHLFHIDFGHFLGNYKKKFGVERERAPFVFTPQFAHILGGSSSDIYKEFLSIVARAYNVLRKHANVFIILFRLMLQAGIPELTKASDIDHLKKKLELHLDDDQAAKFIKKQVEKSRTTKATVFDHMIHNYVHN